jgi:polyhydroxyalkanoate synthesis regulator protein
MTISKTFLRKQIETFKAIIEQYNEESKNFPQIASHNAKQVLKLEGQIQAYQGLIDMK